MDVGAITEMKTAQVMQQANVAIMKKALDSSTVAMAQLVQCMAGVPTPNPNPAAGSTIDILV